MRINRIQNYNLYTLKKDKAPTFEAHGKPIDLVCIMEKNSQILPQRVKNRVYTILKNKPAVLPSLMQIHKEIYAPLLDCQTLDEAKALFPEFNDINDAVVRYQRRTINADAVKENIKEGFSLKMLQLYWAKLLTRDEIAHEFGMKNRNSLEWTLKKVNFVPYHPNYKSILLASDPENNNIIASKTRAWNELNPEKRRELNKIAAQGCKTPEYRAAQSNRMYAYDAVHPERKQKISEAGKRAWDLCPEIKAAMAVFREEQPPFVRNIVLNGGKKQPLSPEERRIQKSFYKKFWAAHPELKAVYSRAKQQVKAELEEERILKNKK